MRQPGTERFEADRHARIDALLRLLGKQFMVEESESSVENRVYYDTFDWRLYRRKMIFYRCGSRLNLMKFSGRPLVSAVGRNRKTYFWWDIVDEALSETLRPVLDMRALSRIVSVTSTINEFRVMNDERKTVARIMLQSDAVDGAGTQTPAETVIVEEIRGYDAPYRRILQNCTGLGLNKRGNRSGAEYILERSERVPGAYGDKFSVDLDNSITLGEAVSRICAQLLEDMKENRDGIVADIDSEFLHDFRIAVRRTRSLISLLRIVLPERMTGYFAAEFKWLGSVTGPVRDIDVYLLEKDDYTSLLPQPLQSGMGLFFEELEGRRGGELKQLQTHLCSERYEALVEDWRRFLDNRDGELFAGEMMVNCRDYADEMILKRFKNFIKAGSAITDASPDEDLHRLRIRGKKFRYLLEFFKSFYEQKQMLVFLKHMKKLQDNLGDFNDLSVQQELLNKKLDSLRGKNLQTIRLAAALGGLIAVLNDRHDELRHQFGATFADFAAASNKTLLKQMIRRNRSARRGKR